MRMDRALRVAKDDGSESSKATNDPRFHVGWRHFDAVREEPEERGAAARRTGQGRGRESAQVHQTTPRRGGNSFQDGEPSPQR